MEMEKGGLDLVPGKTRQHGREAQWTEDNA